MDYVEALLFIVFQAEELLRTKIQKIMYFASQERLVEDTFAPHYYGPYSREVANTTESLASQGFLKEDIMLFPEGLGYLYSLTKDGDLVLKEIVNAKVPPEDRERLKKLVETCKGSTPLLLSIAAKVHFILKQRGAAMTSEQICEYARGLDWEITGQQIDAACQLLKKLGLVEQE